MAMEPTPYGARSPLGAPQPDVMNDPAFETNSGMKERGAEDGDTCRICRGEGSSAEPLFYPCRCSGSIKFVHQECLMGWLSHSQKKHCELCKTPFRFTKLYHPQMPTTVPFLVFLRRASLHCLRSLMTVTRWVLVLSVWLGWVPWCMRIVWRGLFWIGDGGWITPLEIERRIAAQSEELSHLQNTCASPSLNSLPSPTSPASNPLIGAFSSAIRNPLNFTFKNPTKEPFFLRIFEKLYRIAVIPDPVATNVSNGTSPAYLSQRPMSLLSGYSLVSNLTRSSTVNNLAIDVLEGQLIALLVVVGFILVFLIREWVVQQQPAINAGQAAEEPGNDADIPEPHEVEVEDIPQHVFEPDHDVANDHAMEQQNAAEHPTAESPNWTRETQTEFATQMQDSGRTQITETPSMQTFNATNTRSGRVEPAASSSRPPLPHRGALTPASEIQRTLEEEALVSGHVWPGVDVFMDLWRRAESDPEEVLRLIKADGREHELSWIVSAMTRLQQGLPLRLAEAEGSGSPASAQDGSKAQSSANSSWLVIDENDPRDSPAITAQTQEQNQPLDLAELHRARTERRQYHEAASNPTQQQDEAAHQAEEAGELNQDTIAVDNLGPGEADEIPADVAEPELEPFRPIEPTPAGNHERADAPDPTPPPEAVGDVANPNQMEGTWTQTIQQWLWGDIPEVPGPAEDLGQDDEQIVQDVDNEAPFVPVAEGQLLIDDGDAEEEPAAEFDPEVLQAAAEAGINPNEVDVDDAEDIEGILELIGAQGPLIGLFQNGMFCAVLIAMAFFVGVWTPYITGKFVLVFLANPIPLLLKLPLRWASNTADTLVDVAVFLFGWAFYIVDALVKLGAAPLGWILPLVKRASEDNVLGTLASKLAQRSGARLAKTFVASGDLFTESDVPIFSIIAHESLVDAERMVANTATFLWNGVETVGASLTQNTTAVEKVLALSQVSTTAATNLGTSLSGALAKVIPGFLWTMRSFPFSITIDTPHRSRALDYTLAYWSTQDRIIAVIIGYSFVFLVGASYLKISTALRGGNGQRPGDLIDILNQAGGVTKVILIISIEMIAFPLYCGALLDIALLPLFDKATIASRISFTMEAPMTSTFIHWFIGTCYMFHFALFVAMCRKLMRTGVLYFIRDPDDPSFHPVRDVLEKNVYTQLRKIAFSAIVYGALVLVCLGTVVWTISKVTTGIFPIRWSSSRPVLEYPIDLLVYNLVMPIAMAFFKPGTILKTVYKWWFRTCARWLRLTHFLFGEKREDEMYKFVRDPFRSLRIEDAIKPENYLAEERRLTQSQEIASFYPTGHFVRAPASDQVRLPKGSNAFVPVDEHGHRTDGVPDSDQGPHGRSNRMFKKIFIPHRFQLRISAFIVLLWLFASATGIACTVVPLLFGRMLFEKTLPPSFVVNDVYAFAIGAYILGGPIYLGVRFRARIESMLRRVQAQQENGFFSRSNLVLILQQSLDIVVRGLRLVYFYAGLGLLFPLLLGLLWEAYVIIPMLTFLHPLPAPPYTIRFMQSWTLAVIALKYAVKVALLHPESRPSRALRALVGAENRGASWANPDVRLATRAFVLPTLVVVVAALTIPLGAAGAVLLAVRVDDEAVRAVIFRYAYPIMLAAGISVLAVRSLGKGLKSWREKVRDEVFLVGERLHNFGERRTSGGGTGAAQSSTRNGHDVQRVDVRA